MYTVIEAVKAKAAPYIELFNTFALAHGLVGRVAADHICYKCATTESFETLRMLLESHSAYLYQSIISHRRIAYIKFQQPLETVLGPIHFLELSDQKPDGSQVEGFDHVEAYPVTLSYKELVKELSEAETVVEVVRPHHTTHDIEIGNDFIFRCTEGPLIEKIKGSEMV